ncbi:alpha/beta hydrolase [Planctomonas sp. JC2975]|uniref:alpha/beta fold hydrolase n=1 Tax=Planctomonas sp. JC2975 TaxID=2729626 RepID=UPI00147540F3|nr:alpha/beta fold hydrolase [Planctomonas sp. JC2975]NNC12360.1 alpha/beta hydrolase [Planctomonas sp. JC2975]
MSTMESSPVSASEGANAAAALQSADARSSDATARTTLSAHLVASADGTPIEYFSVGTGPAIIIVHGSMQSAGSQRDLAGLLAGDFTVQLINRRGRGASGPYPELDRYDSGIDVADVEAVVAATGAVGLLGISSGAVIAAEVGRRHPELRVALFEPPFIVGGSLDVDAFMPRFDREVASGDVPSLMVTAMLGAQMGPGFLRLFPRRMLRSLTEKMLASDAAKPVPEAGAHLSELAGSLPYEFAIIREHVDRIEDFAAMRNPLLLVSGAKSAKYLRRSVAELERRNPAATVRILQGADHSATQNTTDRGRPALVAPLLRTFFADR